MSDDVGPSPAKHKPSDERMPQVFNVLEAHLERRYNLPVRMRPQAERLSPQRAQRTQR